MERPAITGGAFFLNKPFCGLLRPHMSHSEQDPE